MEPTCADFVGLEGGTVAFPQMFVPIWKGLFIWNRSTTANEPVARIEKQVGQSMVLHTAPITLGFVWLTISRLSAGTCCVSHSCTCAVARGDCSVCSLDAVQSGWSDTDLCMPPRIHENLQHLLAFCMMRFVHICSYIMYAWQVAQVTPSLTKSPRGFEMLALFS